MDFLLVFFHEPYSVGRLTVFKIQHILSFPNKNSKIISRYQGEIY